VTATADEDYAYLTTTGRRTGLRREIEIWFALDGETVYLMAGGGWRAHWVRNVDADPGVELAIGDRRWRARGRVLGDGGEEDARARELLVDKYERRTGRTLEGWRRDGLPVAFDLEGEPIGGAPDARDRS
jgi:deazaflavin-dependent oxidoreductase (nitroreductase family)